MFTLSISKCALMSSVPPMSINGNILNWVITGCMSVNITQEVNHSLP